MAIGNNDGLRFYQGTPYKVFLEFNCLLNRANERKADMP